MCGECSSLHCSIHVVSVQHCVSAYLLIGTVQHCTAEYMLSDSSGLYRGMRVKCLFQQACSALFLSLQQPCHTTRYMDCMASRPVHAQFKSFWLTGAQSPDSSSAADAAGTACVPGHCLLLGQLLLLLLIVVDAEVSACAGVM